MFNWPKTLRNYSSAAKVIRHRYDRLEKLRLLKLHNAQKVQSSENVDAEIFSGIESVAVVHLLKSNMSEFESVARKRDAEVLKASRIMEKEDQHKFRLLPLSADQSLTVGGEKITISDTTASSSINTKVEKAQSKQEPIETIVMDKGFFVKSDGFIDNYAAATADELPETEMNELPFEVHGFDEKSSVEMVALTMPGQLQTSTNPSKIERKLQKESLATGNENDVGEWLSNYGTENDNLPPLTDSKCIGCGANFHCNNSSLPGFVPVELFEEIAQDLRKKSTKYKHKHDHLCRRCFLYKEYNFLLNVNICDVDYRAVMGHLKMIQEALILLVVDMTDLNCSIYSELSEIIGTGKPMIVIGNKVDLLPPDGQSGYLKRYNDALKRSVNEAGFTEKFNILKYLVVSAKTGFGIEDLITSIYQKWMNPRGQLRNDIYVIGCTNAGKSTLFNSFLQSDLCKVRAIDLVERVTTSIWPGTTLSLLKFPLWNPTIHKLEIRRRRLIANQKWRWKKCIFKEKYLSRDLYNTTNDPKYITLQGYVGNTFKAEEDNILPVNIEETTKKFFGEIDLVKPENDVKNTFRMSLDDPSFKNGNWCYDTPGTVNKQQLLDLFTLEELINITPRSLIIPRIFLIYAGESLLLGGVGRIDILSAKKYNDEETGIYLTVFANDRLPVNHMKSNLVESYLKEFGGSDLLGAPLGNEERLNSFPNLRYKKLVIKKWAKEKDQNAADVTFSSLGWISVMTGSAESVALKAWTPEARGVKLRTPPLLINSMALRGKRVSGTNAYETVLPAEVEDSIYLRNRHRNIQIKTRPEVMPINAGKVLPINTNFDLA